MTGDETSKDIPEEAMRALEEAKLRREATDHELEESLPKPKEILGRKGPDPVRYGDWEKNGIISDF